MSKIEVGAYDLQSSRTQKGQPDDASRKRRNPIVIEVADVEPAAAALPEVPYRAALDAAIVETPFSPLYDPPTAIADRPTPIEACSDEGGGLIPVFGSHAGLAAVHLAYADHRPLVLSPDIIWMFIA